MASNPPPVRSNHRFGEPDRTPGKGTAANCHVPPGIWMSRSGECRIKDSRFAEKDFTLRAHSVSSPQRVLKIFDICSQCLIG